MPQNKKFHEAAKQYSKVLHYRKGVTRDRDIATTHGSLIDFSVRDFVAGAEHALKWLNIEDSLPPTSTSILINGRNGVNIHYYSKGYTTLEDFKKSGATHWMHIPQPPSKINSYGAERS